MAAQYKHGVPRGFHYANCSAQNPSFRCRRCRYREYCSKDARGKGGVFTKTNAETLSHFAARIDRDHRQHLIDDQFDRWAKASAFVLSKHALLALNLANNRNSAYLTSFNVFVVGGFRSFGNDMRTDMQSYKIESCGLYSDKDMYDVMRTNPRMASAVEQRQNSRANNPDAVRLIIGVSQCNGVVHVPIGGVDAEACRRQSPMVSALRNLRWQTSLSASIDAGDVGFRI